ncbi:PASTA domain-containing protein, partial [Bacteroidota bacterium]
LKKYILFLFLTILVIVIAFILLDKLYFPWYVNAPKVQIPDLIGIHKNEAIKILDSLKLSPVEIGPRYDSKFKEDHVIFQKPYAGSTVKINRRVYLHISGGEQLVQMPQLLNKTLRDAKVKIERLGLHLGKVKEAKSELPVNTIISQEFVEGTYLEKGDTVNIKISIGPKIGMIRVPNIIAKTATEAERILRMNNLRIGSRTYIVSPSLLPNTIISQYPGQNYLLSVGDSVDVVIAISRSNK